jgi:hypothetical protein
MTPMRTGGDLGEQGHAITEFMERLSLLLQRFTNELE